jgi:zinc transport system permease protein
MDDFLLRAFAAGIGVSLVAGALGCFVVWRRMAYFGDALSHSALLGVTLGLVLGLDLNLGIIAACTLFALLLVALQRQQTLAGDTLLGILAHSALALGLVAIAVFDTPRVDLLAYLFGDILAVGRHDLYWIYGGGTLVLVGLAGLWRWLLALSVDEDLARVEGVPVGAVRLALMLLIAIVIAAAVKIVGVLLITSLLIIPAATARRFARSPEQMAIAAAVAGATASVLGLLASFQWDTPAGPSIVVAASALFVMSLLVPVFEGRN